MKFLFQILLGSILSFSVSTLALAADPFIAVPKPKEFKDLKSIYRTDGTEQILLILHLPRGPGKAFIEAYNHTKRNISIFQFSVHTVGQSGDLSFEDILAGWSGVKETQLNSINELTIIQPKVIDDKANEFFPKLVIHFEVGKLQKFTNGTKKKIGK